jgi:predicted ATPase
VLIGGEAGIGKSRLASEFALHAEAQGARVLTGSTGYPENTPFQAIGEALRSAAPLLASLRVPPIWLGVAAQVVPELRARIADLPTPPKVQPERERVRLFEAFSTLFEALATPRPLVLIFEDVHWAGEASIAALEFLSRRLAKHAVLIIATFRDEEAPRTHPLRRMRRELQEERILTTVAPRHLQRDALVDLIARMALGGDRPPDFADALLERSAGNPLFLNEVIRGLLEQPDDASVQPPASARQAIAMRVARLRDSSRALAEVASIVGQGFDVDTVREVTGWNENEVFDALSDLIDRHIVKDTGGRSGFSYAFAHHVVQHTIYAGIPEDVRVRRHRRVARVLLESYHERPNQFSADVARHFDLGREPELAAGAYLSAGRQANEVYAYDEALAFFQRVLDLSKDALTHREALSLRESIRARRGDRTGQREDIERLQAAAHASGDELFVCDALRRQALYARAVGERDEEGRLVQEFVARATASGDRRARAESQVALAAYSTLTGDHAGGKRAAEEALSLYRELGDAHGQFEARSRLIEIASQGGNFDAAMEMLTEIRASTGGGDQRLVARALTSATYAAIVDQQYSACRDLAIEARDLYRLLGDREGEADVLARHASAAARLSYLDEARQCYAEAATIYEAIGKRLGLAAVLANGGLHSVRLGLLDQAETSLRAAREQFRVLQDVRGQAACAVNISYVRLLLGDADEAKRNANEALELARGMAFASYEAAALANLGLAERDLGDLNKAIEHMEAGLQIRRRLGASPDYADDLAHLAFVYVLAGKNDAAKPLLDELATTLDAPSEVVFMPQFAYWVAAQAYRALGERKRTQALLEKAHEVLTEHGSAISDPREREAFFALSVNREIEDAIKRKRWPAKPAGQPA